MSIPSHISLPSALCATSPLHSLSLPFGGSLSSRPLPRCCVFVFVFVRAGLCSRLYGRIGRRFVYGVAVEGVWAHTVIVYAHIKALVFITSPHMLAADELRRVPVPVPLDLSVVVSMGSFWR